MADEIAVLGIKIDSSGADAATAGLANLQRQAAATEASTSSLAASYGKFAQSNTALLAGLQREVDVLGRSRAEIAARDAAVQNLTSGEQKVAQALGATIDKYAAEEAAARNLAKQQDSNATSAARLVASLEAQAAGLGKSAAAQQVTALAAKGASAEQIATATAAAAAIDAYKKTQSEAAKAAHAVDGFSLSNARAKTELITMAREIERGNYTRLAGSFSIFAQSSGLLAVALSPVGIALTAVAAAAAATIGIFAKGQAEQKEFQNALLLTNNAAGLTEDSFNALAAAESNAFAGETIRGAKETLLGLVASGKLTGDTLTSALHASVAFQQATGASAQEANKFILSATSDVTKFATTTNEQYHYLTAAQLEYVKTLQQTGHEQEALKLVFDAFEGTAKKAADNIGAIERAWDAAKKAVSGYIDALLDLGKTPTTGKALDNAKANLDALLKQRAAIDAGTAGGAGEVGSLGPSDDDISRAQALVKSLQDQVGSEKQVAVAKAAGIQQDNGKIALDKLHDQFLTREVRLQRDIADAKSKAAIADPTGTNPAVQKELAETIAGIRERFSKGALTEEDIIKIDVAKVKAQFKVIEDGIKDAQQIGAAYHAAGLSDASSYYDEEVAYAQAAAGKQIEALQKENAALGQRAKTQKENAENAKQIAINNGQINDINNKTATQIAVLTINYQKYLAGLVTGYRNARFEAEQLFAAQDRQQGRAIQALGQGDRTNSLDAGLAQINDAADAKRAAIKNEQDTIALSRDLTSEERSQFALRLGLVNEFQEKSLTSYIAYYKNLTAAEDDWHNGANKALQNFVDTAGFTAKNTESLFVSAFSGATDALTKFITTGKGGFKDFINSLVTDIIKLSVQENLLKPLTQYLGGNNATNPQGIGATYASGSSSIGGFLSSAAGLIGSLFGGGGSTLNASGSGSYSSLAGISGGRALGGPVGPGSSVQVNESGRPELLSVAGKQYLLMGNAQGNVTPSADNSKSTVQNININQSFAANTDKRTINQAAAAAKAQLARANRVT